ncbi:MFS transporter [Methanocorpusculum petauri]|nr:MFS transporter [Methanocorpusculum petauri]MDE2444139.1 MFS transporter [Methanocorpusculum sp.]
MTEMDSRTKRLILFAASIGAFLNPLIGSMIILAMPEVGVTFEVSARDLGWLSTIFILANAIFLVPASRLSDMIGYKRSYLLGAVIVAVACGLSVFAPIYSVLLLLRVTAALGTSFLMITGLAILSRVYPPKERGAAFGINTAMVYIGASAGPILGGFLTGLFGWRAVFLVMVPLAVAAAIPMWRFFRDEIKVPSDSSFDIRGTILYAAAMFCMMYGLSTLPDPLSVALTVLGILMMVVFVWYELRLPSPVLHVKLFFTNQRFARSSYAALLNYGCTYGSVFFVSLYLQSVGHLTADQAGMIIFFQPLIQAVMTPIAGKLSDRIDPRYIVTVGMLLSAVGVLLLAGLGLATELHYIAVTQVFIGLGSALFAAPNTNAIMGSVPEEEYSTASGIVAVMRQVGMIISMAVCMSAISIYVGGTDMLGPAMYPEFLQALRVSMIFCAGLAFVGVVFSWFRGDAGDVTGIGEK